MTGYRNKKSTTKKISLLLVHDNITFQNVTNSPPSYEKGNNNNRILDGDCANTCSYNTIAYLHFTLASASEEHQLLFTTHLADY